jgi:hypothetical protein
VGFAQNGLASISVDGTGRDGVTMVERLIEEGRLSENVVSMRLDKRGAKPSGGLLLLGGGKEAVGNYGEFVIGDIEERWIRGGKKALSWVPVQSSLYWCVSSFSS